MKPLKVVVYVRVSTAEQADEGVSLAAQEARCRAYCAAFGHEVVAVVTDAGVSGATPPDLRPGWNEVASALSDERANGVVVAALDRLSRSTRDTLELVEEFSKGSWALLSVRDNLDTTSATGRFVVTILGAISQMERELIGERTAAALAQLRTEARRYSGTAPWGFRFAPGPDGTSTLEPVETEQLISNIVASLGTIKTADVLATVLQADFGNHPRKGTPWTRGDVYVLKRSMRRANLRESPHA